MPFRPSKYYSLVFLFTGLLIIFFTYKSPIADFGNYYYGSKLLSEGKFSVEDYKSIHHFNEQIKSYGEKNYFENYTPVPPFSLLFYFPFSLLQAGLAKLIFNLFSLIVFCISLQRLYNYRKLKNSLAWILPLFVLYPFYTNLLQGQSYLLICVLLMESYMAYRKSRTFLSVFLFSLTICLKLFTGFLLLYFILKKEYRYVFYTACCVCFVYLLTYLFIDHAIIPYYFKDVLPRLAANEILEPYHYSSQGLHTLLLKLFSYDQIQNPSPLFDSPVLISLLESAFVTFLISGIVSVQRKLSSFSLFSFILFSTLLISRHSASYSLLLIIPFCVAVLCDLTKKPFIIFPLLILAINVPASYLPGEFVLFQFLRLFVFFIIFMTVVFTGESKVNYSQAIAVLLVLFGINYFSRPSTKPNYFSFQNSRGALYDYSISGNNLVLYSCYGENELSNTFLFTGKLKEDQKLQLKDNSLFYNGRLIYNTPDNKLKPMLLNDSAVLFLSDLMQGVGFYRLRTIPLPKD